VSDFLVVGGGVLGLLMARGLAKAGASVTVVERGECCKEASWAGGGIVSPLYPWRYSQPVTALASAAQSAYPLLVSELHEETGIDPELEQTGLLMLDAEDSPDALKWAQESLSLMHEETPAQFLSREPHLANTFKHGLWMPQIANVRNPRLGQALRESALQSPNISVLENTTVTGFEMVESDSSRGIVAVNVIADGKHQRLLANQYVLTAGAWSGRILADLDIALPVEPVKGQMILLRPESRLVNSIVLSAGRYLIPRRDGHLLVGSTLEYSHFDKATTEEALQSLLESALSLVPGLRSSPVLRQWAGLRPGAPNGIPYIGRVAPFSNLSINAGQYRNGLVLAPASATLLTDILTGAPEEIDPRPYSPQRESVSVA
jgi:glycine oxidase